MWISKRAAMHATACIYPHMPANLCFSNLEHLCVNWQKNYCYAYYSLYLPSCHRASSHHLFTSVILCIFVWIGKRAVGMHTTACIYSHVPRNVHTKFPLSQLIAKLYTDTDLLTPTCRDSFSIHKTCSLLASTLLSLHFNHTALSHSKGLLLHRGNALP